MKFADNCEKGDEGERATAGLLEQLPGSWTVLHNVYIPGRRFNIDHVLIGPGGVFASTRRTTRGG